MHNLWHIFLRSLSLSSCTPFGHVKAWSGSYTFPGSVQSSSLPLGSFWTHIQLFCYSQPRADWPAWEPWGLLLTQLSSSALSLLISQTNDRIMLLPRLSLEKGRGSLPIPSLSRISLVLLLAPVPHPPFMAMLGLLGEGDRMQGHIDILNPLASF